MAARQRSFTAAAEQLCLTPSAVSHQMKELEALLGVRLFERTTHGLELTSAGQRLLDEVQPLLEVLDRTVGQFTRRTARRTVRVRLPGFFADELLIPRLASFFAEHPAVDLQLDTREPLPTAHPATADLSILLADSVSPGVSSIRLFSSPLVAACAPEHAAAISRLGREAFAGVALIVDQTHPLAWTCWAEQIGVETPEPKQVLELDTMCAVVRAAERGLGLALVPAALCESRFRSGALVQIFPAQLAAKEVYCLVTRQKDSECPEVKAVARWVVREFHRE